MTNRYLDKDQKFYNYGTAEISGNRIFDERKASNSWSQQFIDNPEYMRKNENMEMNIVYMSPSEYWSICARDVFNKSMSQLLHQWRTLDKKTLDHLTDVIKIYNRRFPITYINYASHNHPTQEGLHRMIVAGDIFGWNTKFPVMVIKWVDKQKADQEKKNIRINKVNSYIDRAIDKSLRYNYNNIDDLKDQLYSDILYELKYDNEFEIDGVDLRVVRDIEDNGFDIIVNSIYTSHIDDSEINFIDNSDEDSDDDLSWIDDDFMNSLITENYMYTKEYLVSKQLQKELTDEFGPDYYEKPVCREVCEFINSRCPEAKILSLAIGVWKYDNYELEPISIKGHAVILFQNTIYDYTSEQYLSYGIQPAQSIPRILEIDNKLSNSFGVTVYRDRDYLIST